MFLIHLVYRLLHPLLSLILPERAPFSNKMDSCLEYVLSLCCCCGCYSKYRHFDDDLYEPLLLDTEREAVKDLLHYLNRGRVLSLICISVKPYSSPLCDQSHLCVFGLSIAAYLWQAVLNIYSLFLDIKNYHCFTTEHHFLKSRNRNKCYNGLP